MTLIAQQPVSASPLDFAASARRVLVGNLVYGYLLIGPIFSAHLSVQHRAIRACAGPDVQISINEDSVAGLSLDQPLGQLQRDCPEGRLTSVVLDNRTYPGLEVQFGAITVVGMQYADSALDPRSPADGWLVAGSGGRLPRGLTLSASWGDLLRAYGSAQSISPRIAAARFCTYPRIVFTMSVDPNLVGKNSPQMREPADLGHLPMTTRIHHVFIMSKTTAAFAPSCRRSP